jgi:hypothetical protein
LLSYDDDDDVFYLFLLVLLLLLFFTISFISLLFSPADHTSTLQEATAVTDVLITSARVFGIYARIELTTVMESVERMFALLFQWLVGSKPTEGTPVERDVASEIS